jgi:tetratricopeptide (TPR) repeat protein
MNRVISCRCVSAQTPSLMAKSSTTKDFDSRWFYAWRALIIAAAAFVIYAPVLNGDWLWDDDVDITGNAITQSPTGWWSIWFDPGSQPDYYPIKATVQWAQWQLWGMDTFGYHLTNLLLHILGAWLVWRVLAKLGLKSAWLGGLLFAIHPANVESVAWIAELKNTLSLPPFLLAMCAWIDFEENRRPRDYLLAIGFFLAAMLSKTTMAMFPFIILLYAWWKRSRIGWSDVKASAPFFGISLALGLITLSCTFWYMQHNEQPNHPVPIGEIAAHIALAGTTLTAYVAHLFWPTDLLPLYPLWKVDPPSAVQFLPWALVAALFFICWRCRKTWGRTALFGLGFFLINLAPFLGFTSIRFMRYSWVMDHFLYIPIIGLIGLAVAEWDVWQKQLPATGRWTASAAGALVFLLLTWTSRTYAGWFIDQSSLWTETLQRNPTAAPARNNLGLALLQAGRLTDAQGQFEQTVRYNPNFADAYLNLGMTLEKLGRVPDAIAQYQKVVTIAPDYEMGHYNLANALVATGQIPKALDEFRIALQFVPGDAAARNNYASALMQAGQLDEARTQLEVALQINPNVAGIHFNLGNLLLKTEQYADARDEYAQVLRLQPQNGAARCNRGAALAHLGQIPEAIAEFEAALQTDPDNAIARSDLAKLQALGQPTSGKK